MSVSLKETILEYTIRVFPIPQQTTIMSQLVASKNELKTWRDFVRCVKKAMTAINITWCDETYDIGLVCQEILGEQLDNDATTYARSLNPIWSNSGFDHCEVCSLRDVVFIVQNKFPDN